MIDSALVRVARQADLASYLIAAGVPLVRSGSRYKHGEHDSLVITGNMYYWNSRGESGNSLDYLMRHMDMDFKGAVAALVGFMPDLPLELPAPTVPKGISGNFQRVFAYLHKTRGISYGLLQALVDEKLLAQEAGTNNAIFYMRDKNGDAVGAELEGTLSDRRFKGVQAGSKYGYGFNVLPQGDAVDYILFFESAVDLLSFMQIKNLQGKELMNCMLVSMCGLKPNVVKHMWSTFGGQPVLCVDNDEAGTEFAYSVDYSYFPEGAYVTVKIVRPDKKYKDWNEQLLAEYTNNGKGVGQ